MPRLQIDPQIVLTEGYLRALTLLDSLPPQLVAMGRDWYPTVHDRVRLWSLETGYSQEQVAGVLANYNRNQAWNASKTITLRAIYDGDVRGMGVVRAAVNTILALPRDASHELVTPHLTNGSKTNAMYWACLDLGGCPCDRWIYRIWCVPQYERYYPLVERGVGMVAQHLGLAPRHTEALLWLAVVYASGRSMHGYAP